MSFNNRYPVKRTVYTQTVGKILPDTLKPIFLKLNASQVDLIDGQTNGVDIKVWSSNGSLTLVGEILNWSIKSDLSEKRRNKIIKNLNQYNCHKVLIYTNLDKRHLPHITNHGINLLHIGYQVLPSSYYNFFKAKGQIMNRKPISTTVKKDIENKINFYLNQKKLKL